MKKPHPFDEERWTELNLTAKVRQLTPAEKLEFKKLKLIRLELRLDKVKAAVRDQERRADTHLKIKLGGLLIAAGLGDWDEAALRGAFKAIIDTADNRPAIVEEWRDVGGAIYNDEIQNRRRRGSPSVRVTFQAKPPEQVRLALRGFGLAWNKDTGAWEGRAQAEAIRTIAAAAGGMVEELAA